ncbi:MAG: gamma-glutamyl-gamma-aminobutyrate hydrolase family protein [Actinobacteria bacterium]|nr:gamma-glutamyl-gamma-aminobutyrate hydrolase family protein [Actinomycetota bacterium]MCG2802103.1 gamma-glutamyl-gamma-aminobutyrate hydrolase family protein [Cellulomonas sp.]
MSRPVLVLTHSPLEGPGLVAAALDHPYRVRTVLDEPQPRLPSVDEIAGLVVMGGPPDADDDAHHPGLAAERALLAQAVDADVPTLGVCLGAQLLALALGARLLRRAGTEIGFAPIELVASDPLLDPLGSPAQVLHWHLDQVELPVGATLLASSALTPVQAFRAGSALGLQFHIEVDAPLLDLWLSAPDDLVDGEQRAVIAAEGARVLPGLTTAATVVLERFGEQVRARG